MNNFLFSIIIPCYNLEKYISKTINSILNQTYSNFEIILVNDGSIDNTGKILNEYRKKDNRIKIIYQENKGVSKARNIGVQEAKGKYIYFLDGDDLIEKNLLKAANEIFNTKEVKCISFGYKMIYENEKLKKDYCNIKYNNQKFSSKDFLSLFFYKKINQCMCSFIIERKIIEENNLYFNSQLIRGEDLDFQTRLLLNDFNIFYLAFPYFKYCIREGSVIQKKVSSNIFGFLDVLEKNQELFYSKNFIKEYDYYFIISFFYVIKEIISKGYIDNNFIEAKEKLKRYDYILKQINIKNLKLGLLKLLYKTDLIFILLKNK